LVGQDLPQDHHQPRVHRVHGERLATQVFHRLDLRTHHDRALAARVHAREHEHVRVVPHHVGDPVVGIRAADVVGPVDHPTHELLRRLRDDVLDL
jgi:hypothetical protein